MRNHTPEVKLTIPIIPQMELVALNTVSAVADFAGLDEYQIDETKMALIEACINAFEHSKATDKHVYISFFVEKDLLKVIVQDHGKGFDVAKMKIPDIKEKIHSNHKRGWGLYLMTCLVDDVIINSGKGGTTITLIKKKIVQEENVDPEN